MTLPARDIRKFRRIFHWVIIASWYAMTISIALEFLQSLFSHLYIIFPCRYITQVQFYDRLIISAMYVCDLTGTFYHILYSSDICNKKKNEHFPGPIYTIFYD